MITGILISLILGSVSILTYKYSDASKRNETRENSFPATICLIITLCIIAILILHVI